MIKRVTQTLLWLFLSLGTTTTLANLTHTPLPSLKDNSLIKLDDFQDKTILLSFFAPNCTWCHKQMKALSKVKKQCKEQLQPLSVGLFGDKKALKYELRRAKTTYPAALATPEFQQQIGDISATPLTLIISPNGKLLAKLQGYISFKQWQKYFPQLC